MLVAHEPSSWPSRTARRTSRQRLGPPQALRIHACVRVAGHAEPALHRAQPHGRRRSRRGRPPKGRATARSTRSRSNGREELRHWLTEVSPERNRRNDAVLRVFFLWAVAPEEARAYLEREANAYKSFHDLLEQQKRDATGMRPSSTAMAASHSRTVCELSPHTRDGARWAVTQLDTDKPGTTDTT